MSRSRRKLPLSLLAAAALIVAALGMAPVASGAAMTGSVVVLSTTLSDGATGPEVTEATALGLTVDVKTPTQWAAMTAADFAAYRAIILADPHCSSNAALIDAAVANKNVWGPVVNGDVIIIGADPSFHYGGAGATALVAKGIALAAGQAGMTGAYITLSCYYYNSAAKTPVPMLDGLSSFGSFTTVGVGGYDDVHIVATAPALVGLTDALLSGWGNSVHEAFDTWPADFLPFAIATSGTVYTSTDGVTGTPYIMTRGPSVRAITPITLDAPASRKVGTQATLTATTDDGTVVPTAVKAPVVGATVTFTATSGPNKGVLGTAVTDASGIATLQYTSAVTGSDVIVASYTNSDVTYTSGPKIVIWVGAAATLPPTSTSPVATTVTPASMPLVGLMILGVIAFAILLAVRPRRVR